MEMPSNARANNIPNKNKSIPLSTITNNINHKAHFTISTSPPPSVSELKERLKKKVEAVALSEERKKTAFVRPPMQQTKENDNTAPRLPTHSTPHPSKRFKDSFKENQGNSADAVPPSPSINRTVSIPMNKVNEMKKYLQLDLETTNRMKDVQMSSKKRAKIEERLNQVADIQDWLSTLERKQNRDGNQRGNNSKKELLLPANRVKEMKSWLIDFEQQRKAHADFYDTGSKDMKDSGRSHIPRIGFRYQPFEAREKTEGDLSRAEVDTSELPHVSELKQVLIDFEAKNKAHYDKHNTRPSFEYKAWRNSHGKATESEADSIMVTNTSFLDNEEQVDSTAQKDLNMSMMPAVGSEDFNDWDDEDELEDLSDDSSYTEMNVEPVESGENWIDGNHQKVDEELSMDESSVDEKNAQGEESELEEQPSPSIIFRETTFDSLNKSLSVASEEESVLSVEVEANRGEVEESSAKLELSEDEEEDTFTAIETQHFDDYYPNYDYENQSDDEESDVSIHHEDVISGLFGEKFVSAPVDALSKNDRAIEYNKNTKFKLKMFKKKNLQKFLDAIKKMLASLKPQTKSSAVALIEQENANYNHGKTKEQNKSRQVQKAPRYSFSTMYELQSKDFVNQIALRTSEDVRKVVHQIALKSGEDIRRFGDSPGSLASVFRRTLSPSSSGVSGFTDVEALALRNYENVGEHVGFLKQTFNAQSPFGKKSEC
jgi:hypothetical protein